MSVSVMGEYKKNQGEWRGIITLIIISIVIHYTLIYLYLMYDSGLSSKLYNYFGLRGRIGAVLFGDIVDSPVYIGPIWIYFILHIIKYRKKNLSKLHLIAAILFMFQGLILLALFISRSKGDGSFPIEGIALFFGGIYVILAAATFFGGEGILSIIRKIKSKEK